MPSDSVAADGLHRLLGIGDGDKAVAVRHTVLQHDEGNALIIEECGPLMALVIHRQMGIAAARAAHDGTPRRLLGIRQIDGQLCPVLFVAVIVRRAVWP